MGRKIPGRKHRGVKDPDKQAAERFLRIKDKINVPPSNPDEQETPKSLLRIIDLKNKTKNGEFNKKRKKKNRQNQESKYNPENPAPIFTQRPGETDRDFLRRMNYACMTVTREAAFEDKYRVEIKRNEDGKVEAVVKRPKDEIEIMLKKIRREKKEKKTKKKSKSKKEDMTPRLTKSQKWQLKKKEKKLKKQRGNIDEFQNAKDIVKFGETVHAPPTLSAPKKASKDENVHRPGKRTLILKSMLEGNKQDKSSQKSDQQLKTSNKVIDKKGKRKSLPNAMRRQLDSQQKEIIAAYKQLKSEKYVK
nr:unnamed protein product [Callosobruchus chinensis]